MARAERSTAGGDGAAAADPRQGGDGAAAVDPGQGGAARKGCRAAQGADLDPPGRNLPAAEKMGVEACTDPPGGAGEGRPADEDTRVCSPPICCCWTTFYDGGSDRSAARLWRMARPPAEIMDDLPGARYEAFDEARWRRAVGNDLWRMKNRGARGCERVRV